MDVSINYYFKERVFSGNGQNIQQASWQILYSSYPAEVGVFLGAYRLEKQKLQATSVFGRSRASSRRKPRLCKESVVISGKKTFYFFILDNESSVLDNILQEWTFPLGCLDQSLCAFCVCSFGLQHVLSLETDCLWSLCFPCSFGQIF